jgi:hypothetical protein
MPHETKCASDGNRVMSTAHLGHQLGGGHGTDAGIPTSRVARPRKRPIASSMRASSSAIWALIRGLTAGPWVTNLCACPEGLGAGAAG